MPPKMKITCLDSSLNVFKTLHKVNGVKSSQLIKASQKIKPMLGKGQNCAFNVVVVVVVVMSWGCTISKGREGIVIH